MDLLVTRSSGDPASTSYPQPGQTRDSILLAHSDGLPAVFPFHGVAVRHRRIAGRSVQHLGHLSGALIVTDARTALASSTTDQSGQLMMVGQIRHDALVAVRRRRATALLAFDLPDEGRCEARVAFGSAQNARAAVREIATRSGCPSTS